MSVNVSFYFVSKFRAANAFLSRIVADDVVDNAGKLGPKLCGA